jgi:hypothetical protein
VIEGRREVEGEAEVDDAARADQPGRGEYALWGQQVDRADLIAGAKGSPGVALARLFKGWELGVRRQFQRRLL